MSRRGKQFSTLFAGHARHGRDVSFSESGIGLVFLCRTQIIFTKCVKIPVGHYQVPYVGCISTGEF